MGIAAAGVLLQAALGPVHAWSVFRKHWRPGFTGALQSVPETTEERGPTEGHHHAYALDEMRGHRRGNESLGTSVQTWITRTRPAVFDMSSKAPQESRILFQRDRKIEPPFHRL